MVGKSLINHILVVFHIEVPLLLQYVNMMREGHVVCTQLCIIKFVHNILASGTMKELRGDADKANTFKVNMKRPKGDSCL